MNPMNWISPTGLRPSAAIPTHSPLIRSSARGVSTTRSDPKRLCKPTVARKTPPLAPTSSPSTTTFSSSAMARARARLMASTSVTSGIFALPELVPLGVVDLRELVIEVVEHGCGRSRRSGKIALDGGLDLGLAGRDQFFLLRLAPEIPAREIAPQSANGLRLPSLADLCLGPVAAGIVG